MAINTPFTEGMNGVVNFTVFINGTALSVEYMVLSIVTKSKAGDKPVSEMTVMKNIQVGDEDAADFINLIPGAAIEIKAGYRTDAQTTIFKGAISNQRININNDGVRCIISSTNATIDTSNNKKGKPVLVVALGDSIINYSAELSGKDRIAGSVTFQGTGILQPGNSIALKRVGTNFSGNVLVTSVTHNIAEGDWRTTAGFERS